MFPAARNPMAFPWLVREGLEAHNVRRVYCFWSNQPNAWVDVGSVLERKVDALRAHASQIREPEALAQRIRDWMAEEGEPIGVAAAEALRLIVIDDDDDEGGHAADETASSQASPIQASPSQASPG